MEEYFPVGWTSVARKYETNETKTDHKVCLFLPFLLALELLDDSEVETNDALGVLLGAGRRYNF